MILDATCKLVYELTSDVPTVFTLRPCSSGSQWVMRQEFHIHPAVDVEEFIDLYGNLCQRLVMPAGEFHVFVQYRVNVANAAPVDTYSPLLEVSQLPADVLHYLLPSRYCQSDLLGPLALEISGQTARNYSQVTAIHDWIHHHVRNERDSSDSTTTAMETLAGRRGVCRDFAHLGIALCRARNIPARMAVGFLHRLQPMDLHAWFEAYIGGRWHAFDATQPVTSGHRIVIARGRDAGDVALATLFGDFTLREMAVSVEETVF